MKKIVIYFICFIFICFLLPAICTKTNKTELVSHETTIGEEDSNQPSENMNNYKDKTTIKLLHSETGEVEELNIDEYLYGVVSAEMPASYEIEALKAQAVVARTYLIYQRNTNKHENADICDSYACCQAWISKEERFNRWEEAERESNWQKIVSAVNETSGKIVTYSGSPINAFFHSNSGGITESSANIWGGIDYPYLKSVETAGEDGYSQYSSEVAVPNEEFLNKLKEKYPDIAIDFNDNEAIKIIDYTESGRVRTMKFGNTEIAGTEVRTIFGLKSTHFEISKTDTGITFTVIGYGHGVGMSQTGADSMAKSGSNYEEIIKHFYTGVDISNIN